MKHLKAMSNDELRQYAAECRENAAWLQSLAAEAQRQAQFARNELHKRKQSNEGT